ncbi:hypothetical protein [Methylobacterium sp. J-092]|uniref:hypothetical protein n=1 Tax=Methylobacterium sp. J-092 TaxID=2836667 RepID=UPI001FBB8744|nr:hypothetical protein [Methylobacterium sp. J-092]MCJ2007751.1 hypothetical protein [Methylobacterium sp. J-092]
MSVDRYLFRRKGSQNWYVRLQNTVINDRHYKSFERSLGTTDKELALIRANELIIKHRIVLHTTNQMKLGNYVQEYLYPVGQRTHYDNGTYIEASQTHVKVYDEIGDLIENRNNELIITLTKPPATKEEHKLFAAVNAGNRTETSGSTIIDTWAEQNNVSSRIQSEARKTWEQFTSHIGHKHYSKYNRDDARAFARQLLDRTHKSATVEKKISSLRAAFNIALADGKVDRNPFVGVVPRKRDALERLPLSNADMA